MKLCPNESVEICIPVYPKSMTTNKWVWFNNNKRQKYTSLYLFKFPLERVQGLNHKHNYGLISLAAEFRSLYGEKAQVDC